MASLSLESLSSAATSLATCSPRPGWLQAFTNANPISHLVTAERELMNGDAALGQVGWALLAAVLLTAVFAPLAVRRYRTAD